MHGCHDGEITDDSVMIEIGDDGCHDGEITDDGCHDRDQW